MYHAWKITLIAGLLFATLVSSLTGCAYRYGLSERALPGGYTQVAVPMFKNLSNEVGIESYFTDALVRRISRSQVAKVSEKESAPVILNGVIDSVTTINGPAATNVSSQLKSLPDQAVLITEYRLVVHTHMTLKRKSDDRILWQGGFALERVYSPPRIGGPVINSANATYNQSARMETIARLADEMMQEAHDRMTENF